MRAALGLLLFLFSGVVFLGMFAFGEMADTTPPDGNASLHGLAFAWCGPLFWLGIWLMLGAERKLGQGAHLFLFVAVLACMDGPPPVLAT